MHRMLAALAVATLLAGAILVGCGGGDPPPRAQILAAVRAAALELDPEAPLDADRDAAVSRLMALLNELREVPALGPLFARYDVPYPIALDDEGHGAALADLLLALRITRLSGVVYVTVRASGAMAYAAPEADLGRGTFDASSLATAGAPPPPAAAVTCMSFAYSAWTGCRPDGTMARVVLASSPSGCTGGSPVTAQPCAATPRRLDR